MLAGWSFDPGQVSARIIRGEDGREKIQLRLDLGLMQMEMDGRPDGQRVRDHESWLEYYDAVRKSREENDGGENAFVLEADDCAKLLREGIQFYHRYLCFWQLKQYERCARDTARNLRLFSFVRSYARHKRDWMQFDQWRPYVAMMHTRAVATPLEELGDFRAALQVVDVGIGRIEAFLTEHDQTHRAAEVGELTFLQQWREKIVARTEDSAAGESRSTLELAEAPAPKDPLARLQDQLTEAVAQERYEEAAEIRDQIVKLSGGSDGGDSAEPQNG
jgi:hypothetical protein